MKILFSPVGSTDPVRGFRDGALLHILRHYPVDQVIVYMTKQMEEKEDQDGIYSKGIQSVAPGCTVTWIRSGIENPQSFEALFPMQQAFDEAYKAHEGAEWLLNISSGTPQMKTIMSLCAIDYARCTAIQVYSPVKGANEKVHPTDESDMEAMIACNDDDEQDAPNRCHPQSLHMLRKYGVRLQIESLIDEYEYAGALEIAKQNQGLFSDTVLRLLRHGAYRSNLMWKKANQVIADYKGKPLIPQASDMQEYFLAAEIRQEKGELPDFIVKLSPLLMEIGMKYLWEMPKFRIEDYCFWNKRKECWILKRAKANAINPKFVSYIEGYYGNMLRDDPLKFETIVHLCQYWSDHELSGNMHHAQVTDCFCRLRNIEESVRNQVAHRIVNISDEEIRRITKEEQGTSIDSSGIMRLLHRAVQLVYKRDILLQNQYGALNQMIKEELK